MLISKTKEMKWFEPKNYEDRSIYGQDKTECRGYKICPQNLWILVKYVVPFEFAKDNLVYKLVSMIF